MIITYPNEILRKKSSTISPSRATSKEIKSLIKKMRGEVAKADGVGLAAVQIGVPERIILVSVDGVFEAFINPMIVKKSWKRMVIEEGCLSLQGKMGFVKRHKGLTMRALDENGKKIIFKATGLTSAIFQHEIDHLNGILFIDRAIKKTIKSAPQSN